VRDTLEALDGWQQEDIHAALFGLAEKLGVKNGMILWPRQSCGVRQNVDARRRCGDMRHFRQKNESFAE
jgi:hypothetical protein